MLLKRKWIFDVYGTDEDVEYKNYCENISNKSLNITVEF